MNTQVLLQTYLLGVEAKNSFSMLLAARPQLELYSVVADTTGIVQKNSGEHEEDFAIRVRAVDEALINATFGTRSSLVREMMSKIGISRLRSATPADDGVLKSKNVLTRLEKLRIRQCISQLHGRLRTTLRLCAPKLWNEHAACGC